MSTDRANPITARRIVMLMACQSSGMVHLVPQVGEDRGRAGQHVLLPAGEVDDLPDPRGPGRSPAASARRRPRCCGRSSGCLPWRDFQAVEPGEGGGLRFGDGGQRRRGALRLPSLAMAAHLLAQPVGDLGGQLRRPAASRSAAGRRIGTANSSMTRPGLLDSTTTRSPSRTASRTLCVTNSTVRPRSMQIRSSSSCSRSLVMASSAPNGSSMSSTSASWWPAPGPARPAGACRRTARAAACRRSRPGAPLPAVPRPGLRRAFLAMPLGRSASSTFLAAVSHGNRAGSWNMSATFRP